MSKFLKWLKKDKQQKESSGVNEDSLQTINKQVNSEPELIKNNSSDSNKPDTESIETTQPKSAAAAAKIEKNNFYAGATSEHVLEKSKELVEPKSETEAFVTESDKQQDSDKTGFFSKLKRGLSRTKESLGSGIVSLFRGKAINDELFEELETQLLVADVGMNTTIKIIKQLTDSTDRKQLKDGDALYQLLKEQMADILNKVESPLTLKTESGPFVILMVGVNGVGKTTTIGKMAKQFQQQGKKVMLAAGDTFRAAAVEQLQVWGERNNIPVVAQLTGSDSASVIYDAFQSAKAKNIDVLIADTAGRLQNKEHLMEELKKIVRVIKKIAPDAPHEVMLTLDAGTGQNAVSQTKLFNEAVGLTGISLTKLDGTAKGGVIFAIADQFDIPIRYIGVGEGIDDLRPFNSQDFVDALFIEPASQQERTN
jgi:fused signal recognition particle receptor